jgi:hypothetical protein
MPLLGYQKDERFEDAIDRARVSCKNSGKIDTEYFFPEPGSYKGKPRSDRRYRSSNSPLKLTA